MKKTAKSRKVGEPVDSGDSKEHPLPVRIKKDSEIRSYIAQIQEVDPNYNQNAIINECLERYLPELLKMKQEDLEARYLKMKQKKP